jgi:3-deoxy-7-phosphoheptulonate synthase
MSPEAEITQTGSIMGDARIMTDDLLVIQAEMHAEEKEWRKNKIAGTRARLGIEEPQPVDTSKLINTRIKKSVKLIEPILVAEALPLTPEAVKTTLDARLKIEAILMGEDDRLIVIVGPCSIHDPEAAIAYARQVKIWREIFGEDLEIIMRFYPEKPRTELKEDSIESWRGLTKDPLLDGSHDINLGLVATRMLLRKIVHMGVPVAMERVNAVTPQYVDGFVAYDAIGARTTTSQNAREYGTGTSSVIGFKNTTEGSILAAAEAVASANVESTFTGTSMEGPPEEDWTTGNETAHIILRGDQNGPNYSAAHVEQALEILREKKLLEAIAIDFSHGNSRKEAKNQIEVAKDVATQTSLGQRAIKLAMIESNLVAGSQKLKEVLAAGKKLKYGQSITDECLGLSDTEMVLAILSGGVKMRRSHLALNGL